MVILQPHVTRSAWVDYAQRLGLGKLSSSQQIQYLRLKMLLAENRYFCDRLLADFEVWGENDAKSPPTEAKFPAAKLR